MAGTAQVRSLTVGDRDGEKAGSGPPDLPCTNTGTARTPRGRELGQDRDSGYLPGSSRASGRPAPHNPGCTEHEDGARRSTPVRRLTVGATNEPSAPLLPMALTEQAHSPGTAAPRPPARGGPESECNDPGLSIRGDRRDPEGNGQQHQRRERPSIDEDAQRGATDHSQPRRGRLETKEASSNAPMPACESRLSQATRSGRTGERAERDRPDGGDAVTESSSGAD